MDLLFGRAKKLIKCEPTGKTNILIGNWNTIENLTNS